MPFGGLLVFSAPVGALEYVFRTGRLGPDQVGEQVPDFRQGEGYELAVGRERAPFFDRVTVRNAWASIDRVMCRYQPVYCRTW